MPKRNDVEIWKDISGYEGRFQVSNYGRVKSLARKVARKCNAFHWKEELIKSLRLSQFGYHTVYLSINKQYKHLFVHRLVAFAFIGNPPTPKHTVNHIDGNKLNNHVSNLEWVTPSENLKHAFRLGLMCQKGDNHATAKLNSTKVMDIYTSSLPYSVLADKYNVCYTSIKNIKTGVTWWHTTGLPRKIKIIS